MLKRWCCHGFCWSSHPLASPESVPRSALYCCLPEGEGLRDNIVNTLLTKVLQNSDKPQTGLRYIPKFLMA